MKIVFRPTLLDRDFLRREFAPMLRNCVDAFFILCAIFALLTVLLPDFARDYLALLQQTFSDAGLMEAEGWKAALLLLQNNVRATIYTVFYGFLPFLFYPALTLGSNAMTLSGMAVVYIGEGYYTPASFLAGILPHGIFEIPALLIACAVGFCHCRVITALLLRRELKTPLRSQLVSLAWVYAALVLPLLVAAALAEAFLTPVILGLFT